MKTLQTIQNTKGKTKVITGVFASGLEIESKALVMYVALLCLKKKTDICFYGINNNEFDAYLNFSWLQEELNKYKYQFNNSKTLSFEELKNKYKLNFNEKVNVLIEHEDFIEVLEEDFQ